MLSPDERPDLGRHRRDPADRISAETGNRILIDDALGARSDRLQERMAWRFEVQRVTTAVAVVRSGIGCAVVPQLGFDIVGDRDLAAIPLNDPVVFRTLGAITRKGMPLGPRARALLFPRLRDAARDLPGGRGVRP